MNTVRLLTTLGLITYLVALAITPAFAAQQTYDINTLAGKVAAVNGTAGLQIRFSAFIEEEADQSLNAPNPGPYSGAITPSFVLSSPLDANSVPGPAVTVNQD